MLFFIVLGLHLAASDVILRWEGHNPFEGWQAKERCQRLTIDSENHAQYGKCSEKSKSGEIDIQKIMTQFAPFEVHSRDYTLIFKGRGSISGEVWRRAIATWARHSFAEIYSGHACASCRNCLELSFGSVPGQAGYHKMLVVHVYGYAYLLHAPDTGGKAIPIAEGWLTTEEWTQLDKWVQTRSSQNIENIGHLDGRGTEEMSPQDTGAIKKFAGKIYLRLQKK